MSLWREQANTHERGGESRMGGVGPRASGVAGKKPHESSAECAPPNLGVGNSLLVSENRLPFMSGWRKESAPRSALPAPGGAALIGRALL